MQARMDGTNGTNGRRLGEAKRRLKRWRRGRRRPGRIPTELWELAARVAAEHGVEETAKQLQVSAERLAQWVQQLGLDGTPADSAATEFVELPPLAGTALGECQVEMEEPSRRKLRVCLKGSAVAQLATVLRTLCGKEETP